MLLPQRIAHGVRDGTITVAFRRWEQPRVRAGGTQLTAAGIVRFDAIDEVPGLDALTTADALAAGFADLDELLRVLSGGASRGPRGGKGGERIFRITLSWVGEDPRIALREQRPDAGELADERRVGRGEHAAVELDLAGREAVRQGQVRDHGAGSRWHGRTGGRRGRWARRRTGSPGDRRRPR